MTSTSPSSTLNVEQGAALLDRVRQSVAQYVVGQEATVHDALVAYLARGHVLVEGVPGTAKTLLVRALAAALGLRFSRIQFTPDLMPSDVTGVNVLRDPAKGFEFQPGPIFTDLLLGDEINRSPAKTQAFPGKDSMPCRIFTASCVCTPAMIDEIVGVVGVLPCSISARVSRLHDRRRFNRRQSVSDIVHS